MFRNIFFLIVLLLSCTSTTKLSTPIDIVSELSSKERKTINLHRDQVIGVWRSRGYGWVLEISQTHIQQYEIGKFGCYERSPKIKAATPMLSLNYSDFYLLKDKNIAMFLYGPDTIGPVFDKIEQLPKTCDQDVDANPKNVFNTFMSIMSDHYAHFDRRNVNWEEASDHAEKIFNSDATEHGLKASMQYVIELLQDSHTRVVVLSDNEKKRIHAGLGPTLTAIRNNNQETPWLIGIIDQLMNDVLDSGAKHIAEDRIIWGTIDQTIGYVQVFQMGGFSGLDISDPEWANSDLTLMNMIFDEAFEYFENLNVKAVILDLSNNRGGYDEIARQIASRFTNEAFHAYNVSARDSKLPPLKKIILPSAKNRFLGPTYVLTSDVTVSGGEIATLSLKQLNNVVHVGSPTRGAFSTPLAKALPNGWVVELANETFSSPDGTVYSGSGLPPDFHMTVFASEDPVSSHRTAIMEITKMIKDSY